MKNRPASPIDGSISTFILLAYFPIKTLSTASTFDLSDMAIDDGETLHYTITAKDLLNGGIGEVGNGEKTIILDTIDALRAAG